MRKGWPAELADMAETADYERGEDCDVNGGDERVVLVMQDGARLEVCLVEGLNQYDDGAGIDQGPEWLRARRARDGAILNIRVACVALVERDVHGRKRAHRDAWEREFAERELARVTEAIEAIEAAQRPHDDGDV
jgi:hypothetical protein